MPVVKALLVDILVVLDITDLLVMLAVAVLLVDILVVKDIKAIKATLDQPVA
jgi:hypothetical protein